MYRFQSSFEIKNRKKKFTFNENFYVPNDNFKDELDVEIAFLKYSEVGKAMEKVTEGIISGTYTLYYTLGHKEGKICERSCNFDLTQKYIKV